MKSMNMKSMMGVIFVLFLSTGSFKLANAQLRDDYYAFSCPLAPFIVDFLTIQAVSINHRLAPELLRMHFHDCFVRGCDGSVLLYKANHTAEMDGIPNAFSLQGFDFINSVKQVLEFFCPRTVSCADVVALAARDAVRALYPLTFYWDVLLGRSDGNYSFASEANTNLPAPFLTYDELVASFASKGLSEQQMVILSGAHTIGTANCTVSNNRFYNFDGHGDPDPTLNSTYLPYLKSECPPGTITQRIAMKDQTGSIFSNNETFDNYYYKNVQQEKGLFSSDAALITNPNGFNLVNYYANFPFQFQVDFNSAMQAMETLKLSSTGISGSIAATLLAKRLQNKLAGELLMDPFI